MLRAKMWIQVRSMDGKKSRRVDGLSKLTKVEELREKLVELFDADVESQRLFYRGKQVNNRLFSSVINHSSDIRRFCTANSMSVLVCILSCLLYFRPIISPFINFATPNVCY